MPLSQRSLSCAHPSKPRRRNRPHDGSMSSINSMYPRLVVSDATKAIDFYVTALGARAGERHTDDGPGKSCTSS